MTTTALRITAVKAQYLACPQCQRYIREGHTVYVIDNRAVCEFCGDPDPAARINMRELSSVYVAKRIRAALKARSGKDWSVTKGRGTGGGWIRIDTPKARLSCGRAHDFHYQTQRCTLCDAFRYDAGFAGCELHACDENCYRAYISPADQEELAALLNLENVHSQGVSIMASTDAYVEYIDRAEGREPRRIGVPYWD
jgi:hypothetical protein